MLQQTWLIARCPCPDGPNLICDANPYWCFVSITVESRANTDRTTGINTAPQPFHDRLKTVSDRRPSLQRFRDSMSIATKPRMRLAPFFLLSASMLSEPLVALSLSKPGYSQKPHRQRPWPCCDGSVVISKRRSSSWDSQQRLVPRKGQRRSHGRSTRTHQRRSGLDPKRSVTLCCHHGCVLKVCCDVVKA